MTWRRNVAKKDNLRWHLTETTNGNVSKTETAYSFFVKYVNGWSKTPIKDVTYLHVYRSYFLADRTVPISHQCWDNSTGYQFDSASISN